MGKRRDPNFTTGHLCRFCGQLVPWGTILRVIRTDRNTPAFMLSESACHTECLARQLGPGVELTFPRHWNGKPVLSDDEGAPYLDDDDDIFLSSPAQAGAQRILNTRTILIGSQRRLNQIKVFSYAITGMQLYIIIRIIYSILWKRALLAYFSSAKKLSSKVYPRP